MRRLDATCVRVTSLAAAGSLRAAMTMVLIGLFSPTLLAAINLWDGGGSDDNWTTGANWFALFGPGTAPPNDGTADIVFPVTGGLVQTPIVNVPYSIDSLTFGGGDGRFVILGTAELTIGAGGIVNNDADIQSVIGPVKLAANQTWTAAAGRLQMDAVNLNGFNLNFGGAHQIDLGSLISGTGNLTVADAYTSTVTMFGSNNNTYTGLTDVQGGTLLLQRTSGGVPRIAVPGDLTIGSGATVRLNANDQISEAPGNQVTVNAGGLLDLNGFRETVSRLSVPTGGSVTTGSMLLRIGEQLEVTGGTITGFLGLGDVAAVVNNGGQVNSANVIAIGQTATGTLDISTGGQVNS